SAEHSAGAKQCGRAVTVGVPRSVGTAELQLIGERGSYARSIFSKGGKGSGGAAELEDQRICESGGEPLPAALDRAEPSGSLEAEGDGRRSLKQGSSQNYGAAMLLREAPQSLFQPGQTAVKNRPRFLEEQDHRGIAEVLAGGSPMHEARRLRVPRAHNFRQGT